MSKGLTKVGFSILGGALITSKTAGKVAAIAATIPGPQQPFVALFAAGAQLYQQITAPKPVAKGGATNVIIDAEPPRPYMIGESFSAGILRHQVGYGATLKEVPNPYLWEVKVFSGVGPVESLVQEQFDFGAIGSYYSGFYSSDTQLGARPESTALVPPLDSPATGWGAASKLSGCAAIGGNYKFDKDGKVFASGRPAHGAVWRGEKVYDPRLDNSQPGGAGTHVLGDESTYTYSATPALHAAMYAHGRYQNGIKIFGVGLSREAIDWAAVIDWANDCETNGWEAHGTIYEGGRNAGQQQKVSNLDDICAAGGARWIVAGGQLSFDWQRPRVSLATLADDNLLEQGISTPAMQPLRDRMNGAFPQYISPTHNWEQITGDEIVGSTYRTEDGRDLTQTWALNLVKDTAQAGELTAYAVADSREIGPITANVTHDWQFYKPGETVTLNSDLIGYNGKAVIVERSIDPQTLNVVLTLKTETDGKHTFAQGTVANPPPTPILGQTQEERDAVAAQVTNGRGAYRIRTYVPAYPITSDDTSITITAFDGTLEDGRTISFPSDTETGLTSSVFHAVFWDLIDEDYVYDTAPAVSKMESDRYVYIVTQATSSSGTFPSEGTPPDGGSYDPNYQEP